MDETHNYWNVYASRAAGRGDYLMTPAEVAAEQRLSVETLYTWRSRSKKTGLLIGPRSTNRGRRVVYRRSDVDAWVAEQER